MDDLENKMYRFFCIQAFREPKTHRNFEEEEFIDVSLILPMIELVLALVRVVELFMKKRSRRKKRAYAMRVSKRFAAEYKTSIPQEVIDQHFPEDCGCCFV